MYYFNNTWTEPRGLDSTDELTQYQLGTAAATSYAYDGNGLRQSKTTSGTTTSFTWDESASTPLLLQETTGSNTTNYIYGPQGAPVEEILPDGDTYYYAHDNLGSTRALTDASGAVANTDTYDPYGNQTASTGTTANNLLYAGQYLDTESGLYYLQARYYDPTTRQFTSVDPLVNQTQQPYAYTDDNPTNLTDPTGLDAASDGGNAIAGFFGGVTGGLSTDLLNDVGIHPDTNSCSYEGADAVGTFGSAVALFLPGADLLEEARLARAAEDATQFYYGDRVLARAAEEPGVYHNFPSSLDQTILSGDREVVNDGYVRYTAPGSINGVKGVYEIGTRPTGLGDGEVITHRFFNPGG